MFRVDLLLIFSTLSLVRGLSVLLYPQGTVFQITFGLSTPVELNLRNRAMVYSVGFQLQFTLPYNLTQFEPTIVPARSTRDLTLEDTYASIENLLDENGWNDGRECLLRSICELAESPLERDGQDFVEEVVHLLLTPSEDLPEAFDFNHRSVHEMYHEAERIGKEGGDCISAYPDCIKSPLDSFTEVLRANLQ
ncbi:uncharacterized protein [Neodiprion pinetum]|uniref:Uncharacterized protein LOC107218063 isoform X1 n=1 Tax=Neodiprion lecontei TaxID=441921 RepID=A0A6J0BC73_NEOLC|nr:uncharacterized protein LOC107218063 isoform X1 [Neodiprion lecontei]XP_046430043.1 uncharacterized protein LOC124184417 isoform X1 [Neodiprion fabricii]XP_046488448.1 uncharacterized protein LOC124221987 isoform X1 [Neodiprion pinetum]XP_046624774.1 uncharacterized protein LOC124307295 isoform X1 [Neodiprion virginianus]